MRIRESSERLWCGRIKSDGGKSKTRALSYSPFKSHFVGALNTVLSYKNILHEKNQKDSTGVFTCRFFSRRFSWPFKDFHDSTPKSHVFSGKAMHFYGLISKLVVLHIREEMHRSNVQLL